MLDFEKIIKESNINYNQFYLKRYLKIINSILKLGERKDLVDRETHHILPKSMFEEYKTDEENLIDLSLREHYVIHFILYKCFYDSKEMIYTFNMMNIMNGGYNYEKLRQKHKQLASERLKGKKLYTNGFITKFLDEPNEEFNTRGQSPAVKKYISEKCCDMYWYYNEKTGETLRIKSYEQPPEGFIRKRTYKGKFKGAHSINDNYICVLDLRDGQNHGIKKSEFSEKYQFYNTGKSRDKLYIFLYDNTYMLGLSNLNAYLKEKYNAYFFWDSFKKMIREYDKDYIIIHQKRKRKISMIENFTKIHNGQKLGDVVKFWHIDDFKFDKNHLLYQRNKYGRD